MATSHVARYVNCPRRSHELALERIGRYFKGTADKGLILHRTKFNELFTIDYMLMLHLHAFSPKNLELIPTLQNSVPDIYHRSYGLSRIVGR